jgi:hypothetical protein
MNELSFSRPVTQHQYNVDQFTGRPVSPVGTNQWVRGQIVRKYSPQFRPPTLGFYPYDPTDPTTWHQAQL